jgi:hypothetical protein
MKSVALAGVFAAVFAATGAADPITLQTIPIRVTGGAVTVTPGLVRDGPPEAGPHGGAVLTSSSPAFQLSGSGTARVDCDAGCASGEEISLSARVSLRSGTYTFQGQSVEFDAFSPPFGSAILELTAPNLFVVPDSGPGSSVFRSTFQLEGTGSVDAFEFPDNPEEDPTPVVLFFTFEGSGTATGTYQFEEENLFRFQDLRFEFAEEGAPVPEPGTMLLLGSGAVALCARRRKNSRLQ